MKIRLDEKHIRVGITAFIVVLCSILVFFAMYRIKAVESTLHLLLSVLMPFIYGLVLAYLLCPVYNCVVRNTYALLNRGKHRFSRALTVSKAFGTIVALTALVVVVVGVLWMILPGLIDSIIKIIEMLPSSMNVLQDWLDTKLIHYPEARLMLDGLIDNFTDYATVFVMETLLPEYSSIAISISEGVLGVLNVIKNLFIAIIICAYFLNSKDIFAAQIKKFIVATCSRETAEEILQGAEFTNRTFGGFINGKMIDSAIIGVICFICMSIFGWEYTLLISCIVAISNIIPFFGPFIGAIPSALLLLMVDTRQCLWFLVFILCLQQFDGNILGPKILGETTGIASFWVLFAVLIGGGLFGFVGMIVGIPIFVVLYAYLTRAVNRKLEKRGFSTDLSDYKVDKYRVKKKKKKRRKRGGKANELKGN